MLLFFLSILRIIVVIDWTASSPPSDIVFVFLSIERA